MLSIGQAIQSSKMDVETTNAERNTARPGLAIPARPNLVETAALLEEPRLTASQRGTLKRVLHDTVRLVKKQDAYGSSSGGGSRKTAVWA
jgi:hypothetical protein